MPGDAGAQVEGERPSIVGEIPALGEARDEAQLGVVIDERVADKPSDLVRLAVGGAEPVEGGRIRLEGSDDPVAVGRQLAGLGAGRSSRPARCKQDEQQQAAGAPQRDTSTVTVWVARFPSRSRTAIFTWCGPGERPCRFTS